MRWNKKYLNLISFSEGVMAAKYYWQIHEALIKNSPNGWKILYILLTAENPLSKICAVQQHFCQNLFSILKLSIFIPSKRAINHFTESCFRAWQSSAYCWFYLNIILDSWDVQLILHCYLIDYMNPAPS